MAISGDLFFSTNVEKETLHSRIMPSELQQKQQQKRWSELRDYLRSDLRERSGCAIKSWLQGSYKFKTQIRPASTYDEFDIDLGVYLLWEGKAEDGKYTAKELKDMVQDSLEAYKATQEDVIEVCDPKTRCSRIRFEGNFHIDVPSYHLDETRDCRSLATEEDEWEDSDPKAI